MLLLGLVVGIFIGIFVERKLSTLIDQEKLHETTYGWEDMYYELYDEYKKELKKSTQYLQYCTELIRILCEKI
jgi:uncharacterized membrane-anchored protein YhcB (DUF1043 family)